MTCQECRFFQASRREENIGMGWCRRHAPRPRYDIAWFAVRAVESLSRDNMSREIDDVQDAVWPVVCAEDWCGEFVASAEDAG